MDNDKATIPYIAHEGALARMERTTSRLFKVIVVLIIALFLSNALWLYAWTRYDYEDTTDTETVTYSQDGEGYNNINAGIQGDITNGADIQTDKDNTNPDTDTQK
jgi:hypothetical protein